jgi:hypothetical protein
LFICSCSALNPLRRNSVKKTDIIKTLPRLTSSELKEVKAAIEYLTQGEGTKRDKFEMDAFSAFRATVKNSGAEIPLGWLNHSNNTLVKLWDRHLPGLRGLLVRFQVNPATPLPARTVYASLRLLWGLMASDLITRGVPVTPGTMIKNMGRFSEVFENAFPTYLSNGWAPLIIKRMTGGKSDTRSD